jgi:predicted anti-sigma-YlaC factor YlaD
LNSGLDSANFRDHLGECQKPFEELAAIYGFTRDQQDGRPVIPECEKKTTGFKAH